VKEGTLFRAYVDERGLDAGKHGINPTNENVTNQPFDVGSVDEQLNQLVVFENRDAGFSIYCADQDFSFHQKPPSDAIHATRGNADDRPVKEVARSEPW
jgi:hypothetical protein